MSQGHTDVYIKAIPKAMDGTQTGLLILAFPSALGWVELPVAQGLLKPIISQSCERLLVRRTRETLQKIMLVNCSLGISFLII